MARKKTRVAKVNETDRLTDFPDSLLCHILSFLDTNEAVQTCVLSKRWRYLWTSLPVLNFDSRSFWPQNAFNKFVGSVLSQWGQCEPTNLLSLKFHSQSYGRSVSDRVVQVALSHSVQKLNLKRRLWIDQSLVSCITLTTLQLEGCRLSSDAFSRCLNLEKLILIQCRVYPEERIHIFSPRLDTLSITKVHHDEVVVCSPTLSSFIYEGSCLSVFSMEGCPVLDRANICLYQPLTQKQKLKFPSCLKNLLQEVILHAKVLELRKNKLMLKTMSGNDEVQAIIHNEATDEREQLIWALGTEELELFLASTLQRFLD